MFYAHFVLSKKGPLARIWLAAHWDKKLTRSQVFETNITSSVEAILEPKVKLALRTSGHLLLGVVRIHSRQAKYLLSDCNEAFVKIKMAFRPGAELADTDQHRDNSALAAITLSDNIHDFESTLADINDLDPFGIAVNQSRPEDITMREEFGEPNLGRPDDDFGDSTFEDAAERDFVGDAMGLEAGRGGGVSGGELAAHMGMEEDEAELALTEELARGRGGLGDEDALDHRGRPLHDDRDPSDGRADAYPEMPSSVGLGNNDSEFGDVMDYGDSESVENLETMFQDSTATGGARAAGDASDSGPIDSRLMMDSSCATSATVTGAAGISMATSGAAGDLHAVMEDDEMSVVGGEAARLCDRDQEFIDILDYSAGADDTLVPHAPAPAPAAAAAPDKKHAHPAADRFAIPAGNNNGNESAPAAAAANSNQPGRINLPEFVLPPIDRTREPRRAPKRKRKLLIDEHKSIPSDVMKLQMQDTSEITTRLDLAPPTRKLMLWKETGNVEALFTNPGRAIPSRILQKLFYRNMKTVPVPNDSPDGLPPIPAAARARRAPNGGFLILDVEDDSPPPPAAPAPAPIPLTAMAGSIVATAAASDAPAISDRSDSAAAGNTVGLDLSLDPHDPHDPGADAGAGHDLCNISEVTELPDGACSSYSTNYDCWSGGHPTPHRPDDDDDRDLAGHAPAGMGASPGATGTGHEELEERLAKSPCAGSPPGRQDALAAADLSHMSIEKARGAAGAGAGALDASGLDDAPSFVLPGGLGGGSLSLSLSQSLMSATAADKTLTSVSLDASAGSGSPGGGGADAGANQLQNTMVMLDQQLDKVNEQYPVEITPEGLEKRSDIMLSVLRSAIRREGQVDFHHLTVSNNKKQAASKFYTLLLLGKQRRLQMVQETPYSNIIITRVDAGPSE